MSPTFKLSVFSRLLLNQPLEIKVLALSEELLFTIEPRASSFICISSVVFQNSQFALMHQPSLLLSFSSKAKNLVCLLEGQLAF